MRRRVRNNVDMVAVWNQMIVSRCMRHDLRHTVQMCCRVWHNVYVVSVRNKMVVGGSVGHVLRP